MAAQLLTNVGLSAEAVDSWTRTAPEGSSGFRADCDRYCRYWQRGTALLGRLPAKPARKPAEQEAAQAVLMLARDARARFLRTHAREVYDALTAIRSRFVRVEELCYAAADAFPGLAPTRAEAAAESERLQRDKDGLEIDQGLLVAHVLAHPSAGMHLCHGMLLPRAESSEQVQRFAAAGTLDLGGATLERRGKAVFVTMRNPRFLNAEDQSTLDAMEAAVDVALLDPASAVCVLRGAQVTHPKYAGRHVFGTGINLTHLYHGKIPFLWYLTRELGFVNKFYRGLALPDATRDEAIGDSIEKLWIAAVEALAIGGHCQYLLTMDYVIAASDACLTLPARKEGIIPGAANMRLPRFVGDRIARQAIMSERRIDCDSPAGRLICDRIVAPVDMDAALDAMVTGLTTSGVVSAAGNRRAFRVTQESLDDFRRYVAVYAREQAYCHFSPALIANLERHWNAQNRRA
jgi:thioesterase DpgC